MEVARDVEWRDHASFRASRGDLALAHIGPETSEVFESRLFAFRGGDGQYYAYYLGRICRSTADGCGDTVSAELGVWLLSVTPTGISLVDTGGSMHAKLELPSDNRSETFFYQWLVSFAQNGTTLYRTSMQDTKVFAR